MPNADIHTWEIRIEWFDYADLRVSGHISIPRHVQVGDLLEAPMKSGRIGVFRFVKVDYCRDPDDMFFGTVEVVGYKDELPPKDEVMEVER